MLTFADGAIRNTWLRVTVLANARTGLARPDVFYFGNLVGETGEVAAAATGAVPAASGGRVNALDLGAVKRALNSTVGVASRLDVKPAAGTPARVLLCPTTCDKVKMTTGASVDLRFGCKTIIE